MQISRLDLDGAGSPLAVVAKILKHEPDLGLPTPIEQLALQLGIAEICEASTDAFEGCLITDDAKSIGSILLREGLPHHRRRFTVGHELGHFLIPFHKPPVGGFLCSRNDMRAWSKSETDWNRRREAEANEFAAAILIPPPHLRTTLAKYGSPDLDQVILVHQQYDVSKEVAARAYVQHHDEIVAIALVRNNKLQRTIRQSAFPPLNVAPGSLIPRETIQALSRASIGKPGSQHSVPVYQWLDIHGQAELRQQTLAQANGFAMVMLWLQQADEDDYDEDAERTSKERLSHRLSRSRE